MVHLQNCFRRNNPNIVCKRLTLNRVSSIKYLGTFFDENLKWHAHINYIKNTINIFLFIFKSLKYILKYRLKTLNYIALVQSIISYGILTWGGTYIRISSTLK